MASGSQITPPAKNTCSKDAPCPRSASLPPERPASRSPTPTSPVNNLLPETELRQRYWTNLPRESFILPRGAPTLTANLEELVPFEMTDEEWSDLLDKFLAAVISLAHKVNKEAARTIVEWLRLKEQYIYLRAPLMINETNAAEHMDEFREGMEFLDHCMAMECFPRHNLTDAWDKGLPFFSLRVVPSPTIKVGKGKGRAVTPPPTPSKKRKRTDPKPPKETQTSVADVSKDTSSRPSLALRGRRSQTVRDKSLKTRPRQSSSPSPCPANSTPAGSSNKPTSQPEDETEIDEPAPTRARRPRSLSLTGLLRNISAPVGILSQLPWLLPGARNPTLVPRRLTQARKNSEEVVHEPGFPGTTHAGRSEAAHKRTNKSARRPPDLNHEALPKPLKPAAPCRIQSVAELSTFSNSRIAQAIEAVTVTLFTRPRKVFPNFGKFLLPTSVFMNFLAHETKHANEEFERNNAVNAAALVRFGSPVWDDEERETWMAALKAIQILISTTSTRRTCSLASIAKNGRNR
ncbi:hypothetical protein B0H13DRAFT_1893377 [Mycena leptocephala]|nr:hypothetical protein B0H13DRAFT_1893377 [Mycena leptocephala]